ncbi:SRPBCC family protein [Chitinophaga lutea]
MQQALFILLGALAVAVLGVFIFSLFLPSRVRVERVMLMNAPASVIFPYVNVLRNWAEWSPWQKGHPDAELRFTGNDAGKGAGFSWRGRGARKGNLTVTDSRPDELLVLDLHFARGGAGRSWFRLLSSPSGTRVVWGVDAETGQHPLRRLRSGKLDKKIGREFETGLHNLKSVCEAVVDAEVRW